MFHGLPDELHISLVMVSMDDSPENRQSNKNDMNWQRTIRQMKAELKLEKSFKHAKDKFHEALIYHRMWYSAALWKTITDITAGLKKLSTRKTSLGR